MIHMDNSKHFTLQLIYSNLIESAIVEFIMWPGLQKLTMWAQKLLYLLHDNLINYLY